MYRRQPCAVIAHGKSVPFSMILPLLLLAAALFLFGFYPALLNNLTQPAGEALMQILGG
jgi:NADH:ubiquinone oxidoreductase subunit 4 (subunit M)